MCASCGEWVYSLDGAQQLHCGQPTVNRVLRADEEREERRREEERQQIETDFEHAILDFTEHHIATLVRKYRQTHVVDDYGMAQDVGWTGELRYFVTNVLRIDEESDKYLFAAQVVHAAVAQAVVAQATQAPEDAVEVESLSPTEFELYCADQLSANGWVTRTTRASGDQGVDIIAERDGLRLVIQCKLYAAPVGNGAVQQVIAGMAYEDADFGCVVSNTTYTISARSLASKSGVLLLHYEDLPRLTELIIGS